MLIAFFSAFTVRAQDTATAGTRSAGNATFSYAYHGDSWLNGGSIGLLVLLPGGSRRAPDATTSLTDSWSATGLQSAVNFDAMRNFVISASSDSWFNPPNQFVVPAFGLRRRPDDILRKSGDPVPPPALVWVNPATESYEENGGNHFEAGMGGQFVFRRESRYPVTVMFPVNMAVNDDACYISGHFGYVSGGVNVRIPLSFVPGRYGKWTAGVSADVCYWGTTTTEFLESIDAQPLNIGAAFSVEL